MTKINDSVPITWDELFRQAVERFGDDPDRVQSYVSERVADMPAEDRVRLEEEISRVLAFQAPHHPSVLQ